MADTPTTDPLDVRMARLEGAYEQLNERFGSLEARMDSLERGVDVLRAEVAELRRTGRTQFFWLLGIILAGWVVPLALQTVLG